MTENELGKILKYMYENAPSGEKTTMIHLFGVKYAEVIERSNLDKQQIMKSSGLPPSYYTEVVKGIRLAKHVVAK